MRKRGRALEPKGLRPRAALLAGTVLTGLVFLLAPTASAEPDAGRLTGFATQAQQVGLLEQETTGLRSPSGLAFSPANNAFYVIDASPGGPRPAATEVVTLTPFELIPFTDRSGSTRIAATLRDPINMAFDARYGRLLLLSGDGHLLEVQASPNGDLLPETLVAHDVTGLGLQSPQGMAVDPASGEVFVLDARIGRIVRLQPEADGSFDSATTSEIYPQVRALSRVRGSGLRRRQRPSLSRRWLDVVRAHDGRMPSSAPSTSRARISPTRRAWSSPRARTRRTIRVPRACTSPTAAASR